MHMQNQTKPLRLFGPARKTNAAKQDIRHWLKRRLMHYREWAGNGQGIVFVASARSGTTGCEDFLTLTY